MTLTPVEILQYLGLTVPPEGIEVGESIEYHRSMLTLLGRTMDLRRIADEDVNRRSEALRDVMRRRGLAPPGDSPDTTPHQAADMSRATMRGVMQEVYGFVDDAVAA